MKMLKAIRLRGGKAGAFMMFSDSSKEYRRSKLKQRNIDLL